MKTIEQVAAYLIKKKISFEYSAKFMKSVIVKDSEFTVFHYATYHTDTGKLVLLDLDYNEVDINKI